MYELATNLEDGIDGVAVLPVAGCHVQVPCHGHGLHRSTAAAGRDHGRRSGRPGASGEGRRGEATLQALSAESRWEWWGVAGSIIVSLWLTLPLPVLKRKKFEPAPRAPGFLLVCSFSLLGSAHCNGTPFIALRDDHSRPHRYSRPTTCRHENLQTAKCLDFVANCASS